MNSQLKLSEGDSGVTATKSVLLTLDSNISFQAIQTGLGTSLLTHAYVSTVWTLVSLIIAKFISLSERCFVVALLSALYIYYFGISCPCNFHIDKFI